MRRIRIIAESVEMTAVLNDSETARQVWEALPIESRANRWGAEVYFTIPVETGEEDPQVEVPSGTIAYWPPGQAFCIFFGQKPASQVNVIGSLEGDASEFDKVRSGEKISVERVESEG